MGSLKRDRLNDEVRRAPITLCPSMPPDLDPGFTFPQAIPGLNQGHPQIREKAKGYTDLWITGSRELFRIV
jgi:hypothetical protein